MRGRPPSSAEPQRTSAHEIVVLLGAAAVSVLGLVAVMAGASQGGCSANPIGPEPAAAIDAAVDVGPAPAGPPAIDDLTPSITGVLAAEGHASLVARDALERLLPRSIVNVLIARDAVLVIADGPARP